MELQVKSSDRVRDSELTTILRSFKREFLVVGAFSVVINLLMLSPTIYMLQIFDRVVLSRSELTLLAVTLVTLFLFILMAVAEWARSQLLVRAGMRLDERLNARVFRAGFEAALVQTSANPAQPFSDLVSVRQFLTGSGIFAFFDAPWTPIYLFVLFLLHPVVGAVATVFSLVLAFTTYFGHRLTRDSTAALMANTSSVNAYAQSKLRNAEVVAALGMLDPLRDRWHAQQAGLLHVAARAQRLNSAAQSMSKFVRYSEQSLMLGIGALLVIKGEMTAGGMIAANILMSRALAPLDQLTASWKSFIAARTAYRSLDALLREYPQREGSGVPDSPSGRIQLQDLVAAVPVGGREILHRLNADFSAGAAIAIVGPSGSGKSTLARVLVGIWPEIRGRVLFDGVPLASLDRNFLGPHVGYLPQDVEMLEGNIAENISRFGTLDSIKVIEAAKRTGVHEMILRFPAGYDTPMGEAANTLSGGQRQRIGLARALYGDPALVVLDEPDANLDEAGLAALGDALRQLKRMKKTIFLITHRMALMTEVDRIVLLLDGEIRVHGTRDHVLATLGTPGHEPGFGFATQPA